MKKTMSLSCARKIANKLAKKLRPLCSTVEVAGSIRRGKPMVGDIDIVAAVPAKKRKAFNDLLIKLFGRQITNTSRGNRSGQFCGIPVQVVDVPPSSFGAALLMATGSAKFNISMRALAIHRGMKLNRYGLFWRFNEAPVQKILRTEKSIFECLGKTYVLPKERG